MNIFCPFKLVSLCTYIAASSSSTDIFWVHDSARDSTLNLHGEVESYTSLEVNFPDLWPFASVEIQFQLLCTMPSALRAQSIFHASFGKQTKILTAGSTNRVQVSALLESSPCGAWPMEMETVTNLRTGRDPEGGLARSSVT